MGARRATAGRAGRDGGQAWEAVARLSATAHWSNPLLIHLLRSSSSRPLCRPSTRNGVFMRPPPVSCLRHNVNNRFASRGFVVRQALERWNRRATTHRRRPCARAQLSPLPKDAIATRQAGVCERTSCGRRRLGCRLLLDPGLFAVVRVNSLTPGVRVARSVRIVDRLAPTGLLGLRL